VLVTGGSAMDPQRIEAVVASQLETMDAAHAARVDSLAANVGDLKAELAAEMNDRLAQGGY